MSELIISEFKRAFISGFKPVKMQLLSEWADERRRIPRGASPEPGRWRTSRTPYLKEIMDELSPDSKTQSICAMKGTQLGITEVANNLIFAVMDQYKGPILMVMPTESVVKKHSKKKITPAIKAMPDINAIVKHSKNRGDGGSMFEKEFIGGALTMGWSNTNATFRSDSIQWLILDDVDGFPDDVDNEGSPIELGKNRTNSFGSKRKIFINSTPTIAKSSNIEKEFEDSDQRHYYMPCPLCTPTDKSKQHRGNMVRFEWNRFKFEYKDFILKSDIRFRCPHCKELIEEHHKSWMMSESAGAKWIPHNPGHLNKGYKIPSFYSPIGWVDWNQIVREFLKATKQLHIEHKNTLMKSWKNTRLAEVFEEEYEKIDTSGMIGRKEDYTAQVPDSVLMLTAGADVQKNRIEIEVIGWGKNYESWAIEYKVIFGDTTQPEIWESVKDFILAKSWMNESDEMMRVYAGCIDAGYLTETVTGFCRKLLSRRIYATKGASSRLKSIVPRKPSRTKKDNNPLYVVDSDQAKDEISWHITSEGGAGFMHFPNDPAYDDEYFKQLGSERKGKSGRWEKARDRNEVIDVRVENYIALLMSSVDFELLSLRGSKLGVVVENQKPPRRRILNKGIRG